MYKIDFTNKDIIKRIGYFCEKKKISFYELSLRLGMNKNYMYKIESGKARLNTNILCEILNILEITFYELFHPNLDSWEENKKEIKDFKILSDEDKIFLGSFKHLNNEERKALLTLIKMKK